MKIKIAISIIILAVLSTNLSNQLVFAQEFNYSAKVYPVTQRYVAKPDFKLIESRVTIQNSGEDALFKVSTKMEEEFLNTKLLYLDEDQKWSPVDQPIFIKSKASKIIMIQVSPRNKLDERDYVVETDIVLTPPYSPLSSSKHIQIEPQIKSKIVIGVTKNGYTNIKAKIAYFTNLNGMTILSDQAPKLVLLLQNLNNHSLDIEGIVEIKRENRSETIKLIPITIEANNQSNLTNSINSEYISIGENLNFGKYDLSAKIYTDGSKEPTIFANYSLWVLPHTIIYSAVGSLIVVLFVSFFYHFLYQNHGR